jgi:hypothetical protein
LIPGELLHAVDGTVVVVVRVKSFTGARVMRDLTVNRVHTYYVMAGNTPELVHNCGVDPATPTGSKGNPLDIRTPNKPGVVDGREYTGHAFDRMQRQG